MMSFPSFVDYFSRMWRTRPNFSSPMRKALASCACTRLTLPLPVAMRRTASDRLVTTRPLPLRRGSVLVCFPVCSVTDLNRLVLESPRPLPDVWPGPEPCGRTRKRGGCALLEGGRHASHRPSRRNEGIVCRCARGARLRPYSRTGGLKEGDFGESSCSHPTSPVRSPEFLRGCPRLLTGRNQLARNAFASAEVPRTHFSGTSRSDGSMS